MSPLKRIFDSKLDHLFIFFPPVCVAVSQCRSELCFLFDTAMIKTQTYWAIVLQGSVGPAWQLNAEATATKTKSTRTGWVIRCCYGGCYVRTFVCVCAFEVVFVCECKQPAFSSCVSRCICSLAPEGFG